MDWASLELFFSSPPSLFGGGKDIVDLSQRFFWFFYGILDIFWEKWGKGRKGWSLIWHLGIETLNESIFGGVKARVGVWELGMCFAPVFLAVSFYG